MGKRKALDEGYQGGDPVKKARKILVEEIKVLWEKARVKTLNKQERAPLIQTLFEKIEGKMEKLIVKHDACRVVQTCLKHGTPQQKEKIYTELHGILYQLMTNAYGVHLAKKLFIRLPDKRDKMINEFKGLMPKLLRHKIAAPVLDLVYSQLSRSNQKMKIIQEFYGPQFLISQGDAKNLAEFFMQNPEKKASVLRYLGDQVEKLINKGEVVIRLNTFHKVTNDYLTFANAKQVEEVIAQLKEHLASIAHTQSGAFVSVICASYGTAKDRKVMIKGLQEYVPELCVGEYSHLLILRLLDVTDDSVLVARHLLKSIVQGIDTLVMNKYGRLCFLHALVPRSLKYFSLHDCHLLSPEIDARTEGQHKLIPTSNKPLEMRQEHLLSHLSAPLIEVCLRSTKELIVNPHGSAVLQETVLHAKGDKTELYQKIAELAAEESENMLETATAKKVLKTLITAVEDSSFVTQLAANIQDPAHWAKHKEGSTVILQLLQHSTTQKKMKAQLLRDKTLLKGAAGAPKLIADILKAK